MGGNEELLLERFQPVTQALIGLPQVQVIETEPVLRVGVLHVGRLRLDVKEAVQGGVGRMLSGIKQVPWVGGCHRDVIEK